MTTEELGPDQNCAFGRSGLNRFARSGCLRHPMFLLVGLAVVLLGRLQAATPTVSSITPNTITQGTSYQYVTITGTNFTSSSYHQYSVSGGANWAWAESAPTINSSTSMTIVAANTTVQTMYYRVCASYGSTSACSGSVTVTVTAAASALSITTASLASATVGTAYSQTVAASGGTTPYGWSVSSGALPTGLSINSSTGAISGTPTSSGTFSFTVMVRDSTSPQKTDSKTDRKSVV